MKIFSYFSQNFSVKYLFLLELFKKWYLIIVFFAIIILYWVVKGLINLGVIAWAEKNILESLIKMTAVAKNCTPKLYSVEEFLQCVSNIQKRPASAFNSTINSSNITKEINKIMNEELPHWNPYNARALKQDFDKKYRDTKKE